MGEIQLLNCRELLGAGSIPMAWAVKGQKITAAADRGLTGSLDLLSLPSLLQPPPFLGGYMQYSRSSRFLDR